MAVLSCAFTGHRPNRLPFGSDERSVGCVALKALLRLQIARLYNEGVRVFCSGMAQGVDLWCAEMVLDMKAELPGLLLMAVIPHPKQSETWPEELRQRYKHALQRCDRQVCVSPVYTRGCYYARNRYLVDRADIVLAVYDPQSVAGHSGTGQTVRYAQAEGKRLVCIDPFGPSIY